MFVKVVVSLVAAAHLLMACPASACTLWALSGQDVRGGGVFIAKNRDFTPDHPNTLALVTPEKGFKVLSLVSIPPSGGKSLVGGVNERGLAVVTATVGTLAKKERLDRIRENGLKNPVRAILTQFSSVAELEARPDVLASLSPVFALVADARDVAVLESAGGSWRMWRVASGSAAAHTNHSLSAGFPEIRSREDAPGSVTRLGRVQALMAGLAAPAGFKAFTDISLDRADGPDCSLFRTGSDEGKPRTLATLAVNLRAGQAPHVFVRLTNQDEPVAQRSLVLDERFWRDAPSAGRMREILR